jgi:hypothetical protein
MLGVIHVVVAHDCRHAIAPCLEVTEAVNAPHPPTLCRYRSTFNSEHTPLRQPLWEALRVLEDGGVGERCFYVCQAVVGAPCSSSR